MAYLSTEAPGRSSRSRTPPKARPPTSPPPPQLLAEKENAINVSINAMVNPIGPIDEILKQLGCRSSARQQQATSQLKLWTNTRPCSTMWTKECSLAAQWYKWLQKNILKQSWPIMFQSSFHHEWRNVANRKHTACIVTWYAQLFIILESPVWDHYLSVCLNPIWLFDYLILWIIIAQ